MKVSPDAVRVYGSWRELAYATLPRWCIWIYHTGRSFPKSLRIYGVGACLLVASSALPWLDDPVHGPQTPWQLPVIIGWGWQNAFCSYGLLCLSSAIVLGWLAWKAYLHRFHPPVQRPRISQKYWVGLLSLFPIILFLLQYACLDLHALEQLAEHKREALLIQHQFGYSIGDQLLPFAPFASQNAFSRLALLIDQLSYGWLPLCLFGCWLLRERNVMSLRRMIISLCKQWRNWRVRLLLLLFLLSTLCYGRVALASGCTFMARQALSEGSYSSALDWLTIAGLLRPELTEDADYHVERGQALYFLSQAATPDQLAYLASSYQQQGDYLDAYEQEYLLWQMQPGTPWIRDELAMTLEQLITQTQFTRGPVDKRIAHDAAALSWLHQLSLIDPANVYGRYLQGRVQYDQRNYSACLLTMQGVLNVIDNADISSSIYTYMALSEAGLGDESQARSWLLRAVQLDPEYHNNTAREELSGLY